MFSKFYTTVKGNEYIAQTLTGKILEITGGRFGDGVLPSGTNITARTELVHPLGTLTISKKTVVANTITVTTQFSNRSGSTVLSPFYLMEIGLYGRLKNSDGTYDPAYPQTLICYANALTTAQADYIPATLTEFIINWPLSISSSENVTVVINESLAYPTLTEFNRRSAYLVTAGGTNAALTATLSGVSLTDHLMIHMQLTKDIADNATLSWNGGTAYPIKTVDGKAIEAGAISGAYLPLTYNNNAKAWYLSDRGDESNRILYAICNSGDTDAKKLETLPTDYTPKQGDVIVVTYSTTTKNVTQFEINSKNYKVKSNGANGRWEHNSRISYVYDVSKNSFLEVMPAGDRFIEEFTLYGNSTQDGTPTVDAPIDIVSVGDGGDVNVTACGKNLLNPKFYGSSGVYSGVTCTVLEDGAIKLDGTVTNQTDFILFDSQISGVYPFYGDMRLSFSPQDSGAFLRTIVDGKSQDAKSDTNITLTQNETFVLLLRAMKGTTVDTIIYPQLEYGAVTTAYEGYKEQTITIPLSEPLRGIGDYKDVICEQDGQIGVIRKYGCVQINENNIVSTGITGGSKVYYGETNIMIENPLSVIESDTKNYGISNIGYCVARRGNYWSQVKTIELGTSKIPLRIVSSNEVVTVDNFKNMCPIQVIYQLGTPIFEPLPEEIQAQWKTFQLFHNAVNVTNSENATMDILYSDDSKDYADKLVASMSDKSEKSIQDITESVTKLNDIVTANKKSADDSISKTNATVTANKKSADDSITLINTTITNNKKSADDAIAKLNTTVTNNKKSADDSINQINTTLQTINTSISNLKAGTLTFGNVTVAKTAFVADSTYADYPYKADITCTGVTANHVPFVNFNVTDADSGNYAPVCVSGANKVTIYAAAVPGANITIGSIVCTKGVS